MFQKHWPYQGHNQDEADEKHGDRRAIFTLYHNVSSNFHPRKSHTLKQSIKADEEAACNRWHVRTSCIQHFNIEHETRSVVQTKSGFKHVDQCSMALHAQMLKKSASCTGNSTEVLVVDSAEEISANNGIDTSHKAHDGKGSNHRANRLCQSWLQKRSHNKTANLLRSMRCNPYHYFQSKNIKSTPSLMIPGE